MIPENIKTDRAFEQLGLPPMTLAESSVNGNGKNGMFKCFYSAIQKLTIILLLITFGVGIYILLTKFLEYSVNITTPNVTIEDIEIFVKLDQDNTISETETTRKKRHANIPIGTTMEVEDPFMNLSDEDVRQKARDIIVQHDIMCNDENQEQICKDLVLELKALSDSSRTPQKNKEVTDDFKAARFRQNNNFVQINDPMSFPELSKREVFPISSLDIVEPVPDIFVDARNVVPYANLPQHHQPVLHPFSNNCLLARLLNNNNLQNQVTPKHLEPHPLLAQSRFFRPAMHPYHDEREIGVQKRKIHPQDIDIQLSFLTKKPEFLADIANFTTHETDCDPGTVPCLISGLCINEKLWCDGHVDCPDISDEARCSCKSRVDKARLCDGYFDCPFGEDETGCYGCAEDAFSCEDLDINSHSTCFTKEQRCNNFVDCPNRKDELECSILAPSLLKKPMFAISNTEGFLHRNFKGEWYSVCRNPYMWAHDACRSETGLITRPPFIEIVPIDPMLEINYLNTGPGGLLQTSDSCLNSSAVYVTCPDLLCGTRVQTTSQILREDAAVENHLFGRNKRFLLTNRPYPLMFYGNRMKRNVDDSSIKTDYDINLSTLRGNPFDQTRDKRTESRVVGGKPSQPAAWPWMVAVYRNGMFHCGGVVITHSWVVSAAHCVHKYWNHYYEIQVGMLRRFSFSPQEQSHKVTHVIVNQHYSQADMKNDLSLMRVEPAIQFSRWVSRVCLPGPDTAGPDWLWGPAPGTLCTAVGWGATIEHGPDPDHMREVEVPIWEDCKHSEDRSGKEICAGLKGGGKDACQGDSGGPLLCRNRMNPQQWYMAGIVSHGDGCARKGEPGVYTRVSLFVKWIKYHITSTSLPIVQPIQICPGFKCESGISKCLPNKRKCDKIIDCLHGEDELNCDFTNSTNIFTNNRASTPESKDSQDIFKRDSATVDNVTLSKNQLISVSVSDLPKFNDSSIDAKPFTKTDNTLEKDFEKSTQRLSTENPIKSHINTYTDKIRNETYPDFTHASTIELASPTSDEIFGNDEFVTYDSLKITSTVPTPEMRDDTETIMVEFSGESLESRSSFLEPINNKDTQNAFDPQYTTTIDSLSTETTTTSKFASNDFTETYDTTTNTFVDNLSILKTDENDETANNDKVHHSVHHTEKKSEELIIELLPAPNISSNQMEMNTNHTQEENKFPISDQISFSSNHNVSAKKLMDFESKSDMIHKIEDIISSELQPAKIRRKHRVPKEFECLRIYQVVPYNHRCDRKADCEDGTDELGCTCIDYLSSFDQNLICDGMFDCADGQDEIDCYSCSDDRFLCTKSQICLPMKYVCDGKPQCPQGEDELDCFALTSGTEIEYDIDGRPKINLEGYLTKKHFNDWHIICDDKLSIEKQDQAAEHICRYLGFSSANQYDVKYINLKEDVIAEHSLYSSRTKRNTKVYMPVHFAYRQTNENESAYTIRHTVINDPEMLKNECVPNITKTCKSLYVFCDHSLFTDFNGEQQLFLRGSDSVSQQMWPWVAKMYIDGEYRCTGVLINPSWVLISATCLWDATLGHHFVTIALGSHRTIGPVTGMYEQVYRVDAKEVNYRSRVALLHMKEPSHYSNLVKPMIVTSSSVHVEDKSNCVAVGQDNKNNTISVFLEETGDNCPWSNRCFTRKAKDTICPNGVTSSSQWAGIISCHTERGWFPAASFVDSRGECGFGDHIIGTEIDLKYDIKYYSGKKTLSSSVAQELEDDCEGVRCIRGRCVRLSKVCDGIKDCEDGNDESEEACQAKNQMCAKNAYDPGCECSVGQIKCRNGKCVAKELFKDGNDDCGDGTDEPGQSSCSNYLAMVMPTKLCDGILHCHDRSDEDPRFCKCYSERIFKCGSKSGQIDHCVAQDMVCDGIRDCPNGKDELMCIGLNAPQGTPHGTGQVILRSHGVWHSKCYPTQNHTKSELEDICKELGYIGGHAKEIKDLEKLVIYPHNKIVIDPFDELSFNNKTIIKMRNTHEPIAKAVFDQHLQNCYPVFIECL